jgi:hypothetical protein
VLLQRGLLDVPVFADRHQQAQGLEVDVTHFSHPIRGSGSALQG